MTLQDFHNLILKNKWKVETDHDGVKWIINPLRQQKACWSEDVYKDLVEWHGEDAGVNYLDVLVGILSDNSHI